MSNWRLRTFSRKIPKSESLPHVVIGSSASSCKPPSSLLSEDHDRLTMNLAYIGAICIRTTPRTRFYTLAPVYPVCTHACTHTLMHALGPASCDVVIATRDIRPDTDPRVFAPRRRVKRLRVAGVAPDRFLGKDGSNSAHSGLHP